MTALTAYFNLLSLTRPVAWRTIWASAVNSRLGRMRLGRLSPPDAKSDESSETEYSSEFAWLVIWQSITSSPLSVARTSAGRRFNCDSSEKGKCRITCLAFYKSAQADSSSGESQSFINAFILADIADAPTLSAGQSRDCRVNFRMRSGEFIAACHQPHTSLFGHDSFKGAKIRQESGSGEQHAFFAGLRTGIYRQARSTGRAKSVGGMSCSQVLGVQVFSTPVPVQTSSVTCGNTLV